MPRKKIHVSPTQEANEERLAVFFTPKQSVKATRLSSPSPEKPIKLIEAWRRRGYPIQLWEPAPATVADLYLAHDTKYVDDILAGKIDNGFDNRSKRIARSLPYTVGSFFSAALHALQNGGVAISPTSGFHHAGYGRVGSYCTFNGLMVTAIKLHREHGVSRIAILDMDLHPGNGTKNIIRRLGIDYVTHYSYGYQLPRYRTEDDFLEDLSLQLAQLRAQKTEMVLAQFGADPHEDDPMLGDRMGLSSATLRKRDRMTLEFCKNNRLPLVWNLAGGYQSPVEKVLALHHASLEESMAIYLGAPEAGRD